MKNQCAKAFIVFSLCLAMLPSNLSAQEGDKQEPELKLKPSTLVQEPDEKSLVEKMSYLIGFNFYSSAKRRPEANLDEIYRGMKAAEDEKKDYSSFIAGYQMMKNLKAQDAELNMEQLLAGMKAANENKEMGMSQQEAQMISKAYTKKLEEKRVAKIKKEAEDNLAAGEAYLKEQQAKNPKLKELENGMYYEVLKEGTGDKPTEADRVKIHYTGRFTDGTVFDSSVDPPSGGPSEPATFGVTQVVPGFSKTLQSMKQGAKWRVMIPGPMAYGVQGRGSIGPNQMLIFEIELLEVLKK